ncbi:flagellar biosynthesis protein FlhF [candidate division KSB1 bacterium]|nr:flagellar biosynthesis protein FlhF [candidate division KSB1 bacterium]MCH8285277.1 flagellar biosynthesis protein FlhF [candidate division KSB1 bacterium]
MMIKKFVAPTLKEAIAKTKKELGSDAVILKSTKVKSGNLLDFSGKEEIEVLAAIDKGAKPITPYTTTHSPAVSTVSQAAVPERSFYRPSAPGSNLMTLQADMDELKQSVAQVSSFLKYQSVPAFPQNLQIVMKQLLDNEVEEYLARSLVEEIHNELTQEQNRDLRIVLSVLLKKIGSMITVNNEQRTIAGRPKVIMLVGPTGVGKTTTIAKLATNQKLMNKKKVALVSSDTFRIGAIDQLRTFANIAEIPLTVVYTPEDMKKAVKNYHDMDIIYIDTTGRSQQDSQRLSEMQKLVLNAQPDETHLVLSITTRFGDLVDAAAKFSKLKYNRLLLTKIDETTSLGMILNLLSKVKKPVSYITTGQNVPEDIERASREKLARMIVRRKSN